MSKSMIRNCFRQIEIDYIKQIIRIKKSIYKRIFLKWFFKETKLFHKFIFSTLITYQNYCDFMIKFIFKNNLKTIVANFYWEKQFVLKKVKRFIWNILKQVSSKIIFKKIIVKSQVIKNSRTKNKFNFSFRFSQYFIKIGSSQKEDL